MGVRNGRKDKGRNGEKEWEGTVKERILEEITH